MIPVRQSRSAVRRCAALLVFILALQSPAFADTSSTGTAAADTSTDKSSTTKTEKTETETKVADELKAEPYTAEEFPQWARDLRRADIIAFGSLPFTLFFSKFSIDFYRYSQNDWDRRYAPWPLKSAGAIEMDEDQRIAALVAAGVGSIVLAVVDHVIVRMKRRAVQRAAESRIPPAITTEREGWPPVVDLPAPEAAPPPPSDRPSDGEAKAVDPPVDGVK